MPSHHNGPVNFDVRFPKLPPSDGKLSLALKQRFCYDPHVDYQIDYFSEEVEEDILSLPDTLAARYVVLTRRMIAIGSNLGPPHTDSFGDGLFELRLKGVEGIARVFFCTLVGRRIMMLHSFIKKTQKTPLREIEIARRRMKDIKHANPR